MQESFRRACKRHRISCKIGQWRRGLPAEKRRVPGRGKPTGGNVRGGNAVRAGGLCLGAGNGGKTGKRNSFRGIPACARPFRLNALGAANEIAENRRTNRHSGSSSCVISDTVPSCWCGLPGNLRWSHSILPILLRHPTAKGAPLSRIWSRAIGRRKDI